MSSHERNHAHHLIEKTRKALRTAQAREAAIKRLFKKFDKGKKGFLNRHELHLFMEWLGLETDLQTFHHFMHTFHIKADDVKVSFEQFKAALDAMEDKCQKIHSGLKALFEKFDDQKTGTIKRKNLKHLLHAINEFADPKTVDRLMIQFENDSNPNDITFDEFERWVIYRESEVQEHRLFVKIFDAFDVDGDGHLSLSEIDLLLRELGPHVHPGERRALAEQFSKHGAGLSKEAFGVHIHEMHRQREAFDEAIAELFDEVDVDGNGAITGDDVPLLLSKLGIKPTEHNAEKFMTHFFGFVSTISFAEFRAMALSLLHEHHADGAKKFQRTKK